MPSPLESVPGAAQPKPNVRKTLDTTSNHAQNNSPPIRNTEYVRMPAQATVTIEAMMIIAIGQTRSNDET